MNVSNFLEDSMNNEELQKISNFHRQDLHYKSWVNIPENIKIISFFLEHPQNLANSNFLQLDKKSNIRYK